jgi:hypothetical protein
MGRSVTERKVRWWLTCGDARWRRQRRRLLLREKLLPRQRSEKQRSRKRRRGSAAIVRKTQGPMTRATVPVLVMKLFMMMRSRAMDVIPSRAQLGGTLLKQASNAIDAEIADTVKGKDVVMSYMHKPIPITI